MLKEEGRSASGIAKNDPLSAWLDLFRWVAAFAVVLTHMNAIYYVKVMTLPAHERSLVHMGLAFLSGWGRPAVMIFFVLSGYLVGGGAWRRYQRNGSFSPGGYMVARISRLWLVVLPGLTLITLIFLFGTHVFDGWTNGAYSIVSDEQAGSGLAAGEFVCNAFFLQTALCRNYAGDGALWSLFNEFWYYCAWCLLMMAVVTRRGSLRLLLPILAFGLLLGLSILQAHTLGKLRDDLIIYFSIWLLGVAAASDQRWLPALPSLPAAAIAVVALLFWRFRLSPPDIGDRFILELCGDLLITTSFVHLLVAMQRSKSLIQPPFARLHVGMAAFSFSLYVLHEPILYAYDAALRRFAGIGYVIVPRQLVDYLVGLSAVAVCLAIAFIFGWCTERHTVVVRDTISRWLGLPRG